jgi:hypothetical protein
MPKASATTMTTQDEELEAFRKIARAHNNEGRVTFESRDALIRAVAEEQATAMSAIERPKNKESDAGFGQPFRKLSLVAANKLWRAAGDERTAVDDRSIQPRCSNASGGPRTGAKPETCPQQGCR